MENLLKIKLYENSSGGTAAVTVSMQCFVNPFTIQWLGAVGP